MTSLYAIRGRGAAFNPPNRFEPVECIPDGDTLDADLAEEELPLPRTQFLRDTTRTILARNDSPDVGFNTSINPYRGCEHGCIYCFARPFHEYLGFSAGVDFETKILVKEDAHVLLRAELMKKSYTPEMIFMSGVTDCYQPVERKLGITRRCLQVLAEFRNPVGIITKNHLVTRDVDILADMASWGGASVNLSITTLDEKLQRVMEPRTSIPKRRLMAVEKLAKAGVPVGIMVAPIIPGITDEEMGDILKAARDAGAQWAGYVVLRLPHAVAPLFEDWLTHHFPDRKDKVLNRVRSMRKGKLYDAQWGERGTGTGEMADQIGALFKQARRKAGYVEDAARRYTMTAEHFRRPTDRGDQLRLFDMA
ncbi:MAG TPA: PA0069 family radical SAM protein [Longimicrobiales bacterium]|nr:PA0069 family radical SAM protein [Longimicrobiales bacterium]